MAAGGATGATLVRERTGGLAVDPRLLWALRGVPPRAIANSFQVYGRLLGGLARGHLLEGRVRALPFDPGGDDARSVTRRILQDYAACFTPLTLSFGIDRERRVLLLHELVEPGSPDGPGLGVRL